jgi:hypothetical protein
MLKARMATIVGGSPIKIQQCKNEMKPARHPWRLTLEFTL